MRMDTDEFVANVVEQVPEAEAVLSEQLKANGELLLHPFVADLRRMCEAAWASQNRALLNRLLSCFDRGLTAGDELVANAVAVSFVEDSCWWDPANAEYLSVWPASLRTEAETQRSSRPNR